MPGQKSATCHEIATYEHAAEDFAAPNTGGGRSGNKEKDIVTMPSATTHWTQQVSGWNKKIAVFLTFATAIGSIVSLSWNFSRFVDAQLERDRTAKIAQLTTYSTFGDMLKKYRAIAKLTYKFMDQHRQNPLSESELAALLARYKTGSAMYYLAPELADFAEIRGFYEELGTLIRFGAIDFELAFEVITFPTDFMEETKRIADFIGRNWFGRDRPLRDFMFNMEQLSGNYDSKRHRRPVQFAAP